LSPGIGFPDGRHPFPDSSLSMVLFPTLQVCFTSCLNFFFLFFLILPDWLLVFAYGVLTTVIRPVPPHLDKNAFADPKVPPDYSADHPFSTTRFRLGRPEATDLCACDFDRSVKLLAPTPKSLTQLLCETLFRESSNCQAVPFGAYLYFFSLKLQRFNYLRVTHFPLNPVCISLLILSF